ncbi:hypothetical protein T12_12802 [Trichinella patagoniensis]|uniref:Uncharacterized protein n=1 Tax=Trichinella patagoniensis TaxID=990121 RepID=A0A0V0ZE20_9BILA|nr:hypothetical protein T12_12802 [Trichinella patagoniensis]
MFKVKLFHLSGLGLKRNTEKAESHAIIATIELATFPWVFLFSAIRHRGVAFGHLPCPVAQQARPQLTIQCQNVTDQCKQCRVLIRLRSHEDNDGHEPEFFPQ